MRDPKKVFIALACNSGLLRWETSQSFLGLIYAQSGYGITIKVGGGSDVGAVRNLLLHYWHTRTDCGTCLFIDSDEEFKPEHVTKLIDWFVRYPQIQMAGGLYPLKGASLKWSYGGWARVSDIPGLWDVREIAGGYMALRHDLLEQMIAAYPETAYRVEDHEYRGETAHDLASMGVVTREWQPGDTYPRRVPEDFYLSLRCRELGHRVYVDPTLLIGHIGSIDLLKLHRPERAEMAHGHV